MATTSCYYYIVQALLLTYYLPPSHTYLVLEDNSRVATVQFYGTFFNETIYSDLVVPFVSHNARNVSHRFVFYSDNPIMMYDYNPAFVSKMKQLQQQQALGVFILDKKKQPGFVMVYLKPLPFSIPCGLLSNKAFSSQTLSLIIKEGINVTFHGWDPNLWLSFMNSSGFVAWCVTLVMLHLVVLALGSYKLTRWLLHEGRCSASLPTYCLLLNVIGITLRTLDVLAFKYPFVLPRQVFDTIYFPFNFSSSILLIFFWLDMTSDTLYQGSFLDKMKIPALLCIVILFTVDVALIISNITERVDLRVIVILIFAFTAFTIAGIYFATGYRILMYKREAKVKRLRYISIKIVASGACFVLVGTFLALLVIPACGDEVLPLMSVWYILYVAQCLMNLLEISIFDVPHKKKRSSKSTSDMMRPVGSSSLPAQSSFDMPEAPEATTMTTTTTTTTTKTKTKKKKKKTTTTVQDAKGDKQPVVVDPQPSS